LRQLWSLRFLFRAQPYARAKGIGKQGNFHRASISEARLAASIAEDRKLKK